MPTLGDDLDELTSNDLGVLAREAMSILALRGDQEAFTQLLTMSAHAGQCLGEGPAVWPPQGPGPRSRT